MSKYRVEKPQAGEIVKLGKTAKELHDVIDYAGPDHSQVRQMSTGKTRIVSDRRCVIVYRKGGGQDE